MEKIKIITDSTSDLVSYIVNKYDIEVLPLLLFFGEESYHDGIDISLHSVLERIRTGDVFPTTSQIIPQRFYDCYKKYLDEGYKIISIHLSSKMSGTYQSACMAKEMLETDDIIVIDSVNVTAGLGLLVIKACELRDQGLTTNEIEAEIFRAIPHVKSALAFETLENLVKGGRISKTSGVIGNLLGIKPILAVKDGEMVVIEKVRGSKKAIKYILEYSEKVGMKQGELSALLEVENKDILDTLRLNLIEKKIDFIECQGGCVVSIYSGPGACGIFFIEDY
ncbi:MAG: DegV family protein [Clostridiaceae bacterium]|nr:DegV family protein [Clostridiaceae bacterium]